MAIGFLMRVGYPPELLLSTHITVLLITYCTAPYRSAVLPSRWWKACRHGFTLGTAATGYVDLLVPTAGGLL